MKFSLFALTSTVSACVGHSTADAEAQVGSGDGRGMLCRLIVIRSSLAGHKCLKLQVWLGSVFGCSV